MYPDECVPYTGLFNILQKKKIPSSTAAVCSTDENQNRSAMNILTLYNWFAIVIDHI